MNNGRANCSAAFQLTGLQQIAQLAAAARHPVNVLSRSPTPLPPPEAVKMLPHHWK